ncbi:MAG: hypothetical protein IPP61_09560 [Cytophagaceae bacterium]|nr:hypothetical protein [Cytophagaceae bacterium]MBK9933701.1 hypothetical protein [Cytophagaceae bacterium]MBL0302585.1 hypothetical protein [Cytophagaceae bacterium]MBL0325411.1 hypothetical protein [Cytophagaceae bacterium]
MTKVDHLRNDIIDKLLAISNKEYLTRLYELVEKSAPKNEVIKLSDSQLLMLEMSEKDIVEGKVVPQDDLDKLDLKWLKSL